MRLDDEYGIALRRRLAEDLVKSALDLGIANLHAVATFR